VVGGPWSVVGGPCPWSWSVVAAQWRWLHRHRPSCQAPSHTGPALAVELLPYTLYIERGALKPLEVRSDSAMAPFTTTALLCTTGRALDVPGGRWLAICRHRHCWRSILPVILRRMCCCLVLTPCVVVLFRWCCRLFVLALSLRASLPVCLLLVVACCVAVPYPLRLRL
jgi:hypothetical protein